MAGTIRIDISVPNRYIDTDIQSITRHKSVVGNAVVGGTAVHW